MSIKFLEKYFFHLTFTDFHKDRQKNVHKSDIQKW